MQQSAVITDELILQYIATQGQEPSESDDSPKESQDWAWAGLTRGKKTTYTGLPSSVYGLLDEEKAEVEGPISLTVRNLYLNGKHGKTDHSVVPLVVYILPPLVYRFSGLKISTFS